MNNLTRRMALGLAGSTIAAAAMRGGEAWAQAASAIPTSPATMPNLPIESNAELRLIRPSRFVPPDEVIFRESLAKFTQQTGVKVTADFVGWEDIGSQTAVTANTGAGPDIVVGFGESPHIYTDKVIELTDICEYLGTKYGGWMFLGEKYGKKNRSNNWVGLPMGGSTGPVVYRKSAVTEAGFNEIPQDHAGFLNLMKGLKRINKPGGFTLGNAVGDGNGTANWLLWSHGGRMVDDDGKVAINSPETLASLNYLKELYPTFVDGTLSWLDPSNNRAFLSSQVYLTANGVSLYFAAKNDPATQALAQDMEHAPMPHGVVDSAPQAATILNAMVFKHTRFPNAAKALLAFMMESEQYDRWLTGCLGYWSHPLKAYNNSAVWMSDPKIAIYKEGMNNRFWSGYSGPITQASGTVASEYIMVQMYSSVASGQATPQEAIRSAERRIRRYYR